MGKEYDTQNINLRMANEALEPIVATCNVDELHEQLEELGSSEYERGRLDGIASVRNESLFRDELPSGTGPLAVEIGIFRKLKVEQERLKVDHEGLTYTDTLVLAAVLIARRELIARTPRAPGEEFGRGLGARATTKFGIEIDPKIVKRAFGGMVRKTKRKPTKKAPRQKGESQA